MKVYMYKKHKHYSSFRETIKSSKHEVEHFYNVFRRNEDRLVVKSILKNYIVHVDKELAKPVKRGEEALSYFYYK